MSEGTVGSKMVLVLCVVSVCAAGGLWWRGNRLEEDKERLQGDLGCAKIVAADLARVRDGQTEMRSSINELCDKILNQLSPDNAVIIPKLTDDIPASALRRMVVMLEEQNGQLSGDIATARKRVATLSKQTSLQSGQLNKANVDLSRTRGELKSTSASLATVQKQLGKLTGTLKTRTGERDALAVKLTSLTTEHTKLTAEKRTLTAQAVALRAKATELDGKLINERAATKKLTAQLANATAESARLTILKRRMEATMKALTDAQSEHLDQITATKQQLDESRKKQAALAEQLVAALALSNRQKAEIAELRKKPAQKDVQ